MKNVITNLDSPNACGRDLFQWWFWRTVSRNFHTDFSIFFNICLKESCIPDCRKFSSVVTVFENLEEERIATNYRPASLLPAVRETFEKLVNNRYVDHLKKLWPFLCFPVRFRVFSIYCRSSDSYIWYNC